MVQNIMTTYNGNIYLNYEIFVVFRCMLWTCCKCIAKYSSWSQLALHLLSHSSLEIEEKFPTDEELCTVCRSSFKEFHSLEFDKFNILQCELCDQIFTEKNVLELHLQLEHVDTRHKRYWCNICCKFYRKISYHMQILHQRIVTNRDKYLVNSIEDITFPCQVCGDLCVLSKYCVDHKSSAPVSSKLTSSSKCIEHASLFPDCHSCQKCDESFENCKTLWSYGKNRRPAIFLSGRLYYAGYVLFINLNLTQLN
uniref:C2H2-type domain-containing protein n=1 Tax=Cacopsylla melanoneura TaxID=428564 RepID=A0A8D8V4W9_9HEMI